MSDRPASPVTAPVDLRCAGVFRHHELIVVEFTQVTRASGRQVEAVAVATNL